MAVLVRMSVAYCEGRVQNVPCYWCAATVDEGLTWDRQQESRRSQFSLRRKALTTLWRRVFWCRKVPTFTGSHPDDGGSRIHRNIGVFLPSYTLSQANPHTTPFLAKWWCWLQSIVPTLPCVLSVLSPPVYFLGWRWCRFAANWIVQ